MDSAEPEPEDNGKRKTKGIGEGGVWGGVPSPVLFVLGFFYPVLEVGFKKCKPFISGSYKYNIICLQQQPPISRKATSIFFSNYQHYWLLYKFTRSIPLHDPLHSLHEMETFCLSKKT